ncbi:MAG: TonB-dependent receptor plug domain-containing protein, partial [bacterium]|nr:TonB-dependent receptor plug domain-containing protein [bacterium]
MKRLKKSAAKRAILLAGASVCIGTFAQPALAQTAPAQSDATTVETNGQGQGLADIVVTAQRREQSLQKVPISVAALSSDMIRSAGITNTESLQVAIPSLTVTRITASTQFFIRGVGTAGGQAGQEGAVATFLDGVYLPSMNASTFALGNVERIEVLKGPQGTLYGRNATAGAVNVITRDPKATPEMQFDIGYGNLETVEASTYATMGVATNLAVDFTAYYLDQGEGFGRNIALDNDTNKRRDIVLSSKLLFDDNVNRASLYAGYTKSSGSLGMAQRPIGTTIGFLTGVPGWNHSFYDINSDVDQRSSVATKVFIGDLQHDFGGFSLKSISGYIDSDSFQSGDLDLQPLPVIAFPMTQTDKQFTLELQVASSSDSKINWIGGL